MKTKIRQAALACAAAAVAVGPASASQARREAALPHGLAVGTRVSLERAARPLPEVLEELGRQAGVSMDAASGLVDQKVTVLFRRMPLQEAAEALAAAVDGVWLETREKNRALVYRLSASKRRRERLERYRGARRSAEAQRDRNILAAYSHVLNSPKPKANEAEDIGEYTLDIRPEPLFPLLRSLPDAALRAWLLEANPAFPVENGFGADATPALVLAGAALRPEHRRSLSQFFTQFAAERAGSSDELGLANMRALAQHPELVQVQLWACRSETEEKLWLTGRLRLVAADAPGGLFAQDLNLAKISAVPVPGPLEGPEQLISAAASATRPLEDEARLDLDYGLARSDQALLHIARAARVNLAADYYTKLGALPLVGPGRSLGFMLQRAEKLWKLAHFWEGATLVVRSRDWPYACDREPPAAVIDRWDGARQRSGFLSLEEYLLAALALDDERIATLYKHTDPHGARLHQPDVRRLARYRHVLRGYGSLSEAQRKRADREGLPIAGLSKLQARAWERALRPFVLTLPPDAAGNLVLQVVTPASYDRMPPYVFQPLPEFLLFGMPGGDAAVPLVSKVGML